MTNHSYLRTVTFGGYDKIACLDYIDAANMYIFNLESTIMSKQNGESVTRPQMNCSKIPVLKKAFIGGFDVHDFDIYVNELNRKIEELESKFDSI